MRASYLARVDNAGTTIVDERLFGFLCLRTRDGTIKKYLCPLPRHAQPNPPGWESLEQITGVLADELLSSWSEDLFVNTAADKAFEMLRARQGDEYMVQEVPGFYNLITVELEGLSVAPRSSLAPPPPSAVAPVQRGVILGVQLVHDPSHVFPTTLSVQTSDGVTTSLSVPDQSLDPSPDDWWVVEVATEVPASRIASGWNTMAGPGAPRTNLLLDMAARTFGALVGGREVTLRPQGGVDLDDLLTSIVADRYRREERKPTLYVNIEPRQVIQRTWRLLQAVYGPVVFRFHAQAGQGLGHTSVVMEFDGRLKLEVLEDKDAVRGLLIRSVSFAMPNEKGSKPIVPPEYVVLDILKYAHPTVRPINGLVRIPTLRPDGGVHDKPGYDTLSRLWYAPDDLIELLPPTISNVDLRRAVATLMTPFREFPFVGPEGFAATIACLIEQIVRPLIPGARPLYAFDAPGFRGQGCGKTLIPQIIGAIITGREVSITPYPDTNDELAKLLASKLVMGDPFVILDNLMGTINSAHLAALLTGASWSPRTLSTLKSPALPQNTTWCATMNGAAFSRDIARRTLLVRLDAKMADPYKRKGFAIDPVPWVLEHRASLLRAALILARGWVEAGRPPDPDLTMGSFEGWAKIVGGIVRFAGLPGLAGSIEESRARDTDTAEYETFVARWAEAFTIHPVSAGQLAELAGHYALFATALDTARGPIGRARALALVVAKLVDRYVTLPDGQTVTVRRRDTLLNGHTVYHLARAARSTGPGAVTGAGPAGSGMASGMASGLTLLRFPN